MIANLWHPRGEYVHRFNSDKKQWEVWHPYREIWKRTKKQNWKSIKDYWMDGRMLFSGVHYPISISYNSCWAEPNEDTE